MYRGPSYLLKHINSSVFRPVVEYIAEHGRYLSAIDVDDYTEDKPGVDT